jgi:hypothetical protein
MLNFVRLYCKAYHLRDLRLFSGWQENVSEQALPLADDSVVYLWDDFTVATSPIQRDQVIFAAVTPQWQAFCTDTLHFALPDDLRTPVVPTSSDASGQ